MDQNSRLSPLELSALLCSKVCHDVINPVGAIANGLEVLEDEDDEEMRTIALGLIKKSAAQASARLQFARIAFGAASASGKAIDLADAESLARGFLDSERTTVSWAAPRAMMDKNLVKLLLNLFVISLRALPRGGTLDVAVGDNAEQADFTFTCSGHGARVPEEAAFFNEGEPPGTEIGPHSIQPYYASLLARECQVGVGFEISGDTVVIRARPA